MRAGRLQKRLLESASAGLHTRADALACHRGEFDGRSPISQVIEVGRCERTAEKDAVKPPVTPCIDDPLVGYARIDRSID